MQRALARLRAEAGLCALVALALVLRLPRLTESVWFDELWSTRLRLGTWTGFLGNAIHDIHPPLYPFLMFVWIHVFGDSELSIRTVPLLTGLATVALTGLALREPLGRSAALWAAFLVAVSPTHIWYSQEARPYAPLVLFVLLAYALWQRDAFGSSPQRARAYGGATLAAALTHYYAVPYAMVQSALSLWRPRAERNPTLLWSGLALAAVVLFIATHVLLVGQLVSKRSYLRHFDAFELWMTLLSWLPIGNAIWPVRMERDDFGTLLARPTQLAAQLALLALGLAGAVALVRERGAGRASRLGYLAHCAALPLVLAALAIASGSRSYIERSLLPAMPFVFGLWGRGLSAIAWRPGRRLAAGALVALEAAALVAYFRSPERWTVYKPNPDWRSAAVYLGSLPAPAGSRNLLLVSSPAEELVYYDDERFALWQPPPTKADAGDRLREMLFGAHAPARRAEPARPWQIRDAHRAREPEELRKIVAATDVSEICVVENHTWGGAAAEQLLERLANELGLRERERRELAGLTIVRLARP